MFQEEEWKGDRVVTTFQDNKLSASLMILHSKLKKEILTADM
jgi:hypothetical protein